MEYAAPVGDIRFVLKTMAGLDELAADGLAGDLDDDLLTALLTEAGKTAEGLLAPLNVTGDRHGAKLTEDGVVAAPGFAAAYEAWRQGGWSGVDASPDHGGMGLPTAVGTAILGIFLFGEATDLPRLASIGLIVAGIIGLKLTSAV